MKVLIVPDIHGNPEMLRKVKELIGSVDRCCFLGDYINSFNENERGQNGVDNLKSIIAFAKQRRDKVQLLIGNHDIAHTFWCKAGNYHISGYEMFTAKDYNEIFKANKHLFKIGVKYSRWIVSHAGFTKTWYENAKSWFKVYMPDVKTPNGAMNLANWMWKNNECGQLDYNDHDWSGVGSSVLQGPLWVRPAAAFNDVYYKYQIVGHTEVKDDKPLMISTTNKKKVLLVCDHYKHNVPFILDTEWTSEELSEKCYTICKDFINY